MAHNGNLTNAADIHDDLFKTDLRHMNTDSDSEVLLNVFAHELQKCASLTPSPDDIFHTVKRVHERCKGAYGVVAMITGHGLVGFRDPNGIRPLIYGSRLTENGEKNISLLQSQLRLLHWALKLSVILSRVKQYLLTLKVSSTHSNVPVNHVIVHVFLNMCILHVQMRL